MKNLPDWRRGGGDSRITRENLIQVLILSKPPILLQSSATPITSAGGEKTVITEGQPSGARTFCIAHDWEAEDVPAVGGNKDRCHLNLGCASVFSPTKGTYSS